MIEVVWDWIFRITHRRSIDRDLREIDLLCADNDRMARESDELIAKAFAPEEWATVTERCERKLAPLDRGGNGK